MEKPDPENYSFKHDFLSPDYEPDWCLKRGFDLKKKKCSKWKRWKTDSQTWKRFQLGQK